VLGFFPEEEGLQSFDTIDGEQKEIQVRYYLGTRNDDSHPMELQKSTAKSAKKINVNNTIKYIIVFIPTTDIGIGYIMSC
jgi:hypothetical protein